MTTYSLRSIVTAIGATVAIITAVSLPAGFFLSGYLNLARHLEFKAELNASNLAKYINSHSALWQYQKVRIAETLSQTDGSDTGIQKRVMDATGRLVLQEGESGSGPALVRERAVTVVGVNVGSVQLETSLRPLLTQTVIVAAFSALLGLAIFFAIRIFPLRSLDRTLGRLEASNAELAQTNARFNAALTNMSQGLCMFDAQGRIVLFNERYASMIDVPAATLKDWTLLDLSQRRFPTGGFSQHPEAFAAQILADTRDGKSSTRILEENGRSLHVIEQPMPAGGWVATFEDITEKREAEAKISHMALHDALTHIPNRLYLREQLQTRLAQLGEGQQFAMLCMDLDRFKLVNDSLGHQFGDMLLRQVADRMRAHLSEGDTIARLGGDEFAVLQLQISQPEDAGALAARLIEHIGLPFDLDGQQVSIGASIGIALAPGDASDSEQLLKCADLAMYRAKAEGKGTYRFFEPEMDRIMQARRTLEIDLRRAIENTEFVVYYQPLVNLQSGHICGFEALLRWNHPTRGLVPPTDFIPLAEEPGLIVAIGEWVVRTACQDAAQWPDDIRVAVNLSAVQFKMRNITQMVFSALAHCKLDPGRLELEITESVLLVDNASTLDTLHKLRGLGVRISMDDFGTGYSSLSYLRSFPFDKIKIDRSFVHDMEKNDESKAIIRAVTGLGTSLGMATTGEGVETEAEADYLRREGCTEAQGFFYSKAKPASEVAEMLRDRSLALSAVA